MKAEPRLLALAWLAAVNCRAPLFAVGPALTLIIADLGMSLTVAGLLPSLPLLFMGLLGLPGGLLVDRFGPARLLAVGLTLVGVAGLARAAAPSTLVLALLTACMGGAVGIVQPALPRIARDALPQRIGLATAIYSNGLVVGGFIGAALAVPMLAMVGPLSWRGLFLIWGVIGVVAAFLWWAPSFAEHRGRHDAPRPPARPGAGNPRRWLDDAVIEPMRTRGMVAVTVAFSTQSSIYYALTGWLPTYLIARGWSLADTVLPAASLSLVGIPAGLIVTPLVDVIGRRVVLVSAGALTIVGSAGLLVLPSAAILWAILAGIGTTCALQVSLTGPPELAPPERVGATAGAMLTIGYVGAVIGPFAIGALHDLSGDFAAGLLLVVAIAVVLTLAGLRVPASAGARTVSRGAPDPGIGAARSP
ncbi:MAG: MFS transporter [Chloroflexi bacterium]|nr:MFS transporter [Chloroflexota bacterium]